MKVEQKKNKKIVILVLLHFSCYFTPLHILHAVMTPTYGGVLSDNGNSYHALAEGRLRLEKCEGVSSFWINLF